ncbi:putative thiopurine S-methyltransferase [Nelusetta ayraudi]|uniref:putative thiopurine S-methyltransferase n=1 Tax=Nelusetta ayraudi TaxID=303726 RepID=UPI003F71C641
MVPLPSTVPACNSVPCVLLALVSTLSSQFSVCFVLPQLLAQEQNACTTGGKELGDWEKDWQESRIGFHKPGVHMMLKKYIHLVLAGRSKICFFLPLCGKTVDMKWLADMGHSVVGVEISEKAIREFFEESKLTYSEEPVPTIPGAKVYKSSDGNISLYQCDLYSFSSSIGGQFGAIWDRGSLVAINSGDREKYIALMTSLMDKDCTYLLETSSYNPELYPGPPFCLPEEQVQTLFGKSFNFQLLDSEELLLKDLKGLDRLTELIFLITGKK